LLQLNTWLSGGRYDSSDQRRFGLQPALAVPGAWRQIWVGGLTVTFAEYFLLLRRHWRTWCVCIMVGLIAAILYNTFAPVRYTAVTTSFVTMAESANATSGDVFQGAQFTAQRLKSYAPLGTSPEVLQPVINDLQLETSVDDLRGMIEVTSPPDTVLLQVGVTDPSRREAVRIADAVSTRLGQRIEELETPRVRGASLVDVTITHPAELPVAPSSPRKLLDLMIGALAGAAIGLVAALIRNHLGRRIETAHDLESLTGAPPLGITLPIGHKKASPLVALNPRSAAAEQYRTIRSALNLGATDPANQRLVVSSAARADGKSTVAANLAISWAQSGASVCLVEADLRSPAVAAMFGVEADSGLADVLMGNAKLDAVLRTWSDGPLTIIPAGQLPADPTALLGSERMSALARLLGHRFDVVIYDATSMLGVADALLLAQTVGGLLMVARSGSTAWSTFAASLDRVKKADLNLLGVVAAGSREPTLRSQYGDGPKPRPRGGVTTPVEAPGSGLPIPEVRTVHRKVNGAVKPTKTDSVLRQRHNPTLPAIG
jgi:capsular exopolysaccharide synthesis family protein